MHSGCEIICMLTTPPEVHNQCSPQLSLLLENVAHNAQVINRSLKTQIKNGAAGAKIKTSQR